MERLFRFAQQSLTVFKQHSPSFTTTEELLPLLDELSRSSKSSRSVMSHWVAASAPQSDHLELMAEIIDMRTVQGSLQRLTTFSPMHRGNAMIDIIKRIDSSLKNFTGAQADSWYSMPIMLESENHSRAYLSRGDDPNYDTDDCGSFYYIRAHRSLCRSSAPSLRPSPVAHEMQFSFCLIQNPNTSMESPPMSTVHTGAISATWFSLQSVHTTLRPWNFPNCSAARVAVVSRP